MTTGVDLGALVPSVLFGGAGAALCALVFRPVPRLAPRLRPYNSANRVRLGRPADVGDVPTGAPLSGGAFAALFGPVVRASARTLGRLIDREDDETLLLRLRHAGAFADVPEAERLARYRMQRLTYVAVSVIAACLPAVLLANARLLLVFVALGAVFGTSMPRARLDAAIKQRRDRMTIDLYTINQNLAMHQQTGGGVDEALQRLVSRGRGPVVTELAEAMTWRRAGMPLGQALSTLADRTPEPHAARTYKALAKAADTGAPIGDALLHLSEDVRNSRRDALQRLAVRRRATMILPIVFLLVPPLLILIGAPLPAELFGALQ